MILLPLEQNTVKTVEQMIYDYWTGLSYVSFWNKYAGNSNYNTRHNNIIKAIQKYTN